MCSSDLDAVSTILGEIYTAASHFQMRLPELFCGFDREPGEGPIAYPVACLPQAWAAGSAFLMLQASLGVDVNALDGVVTVANPTLPTGVDRLTVSELRVGTSKVDLIFERIGEGTVLMPKGKQGDVRILTSR